MTTGFGISVSTSDQLDLIHSSVIGNVLVSSIATHGANVKLYRFSSFVDKSAITVVILSTNLLIGNLPMNEHTWILSIFSILITKPFVLKAESYRICISSLQTSAHVGEIPVPSLKRNILTLHKESRSQRVLIVLIRHVWRRPQREQAVPRRNQRQATPIFSRAALWA